MDAYTRYGSGWIEVVSGVMFSGKSEELIRRVRRAMIAKKQVQVFKSMLDDRYDGIYSVCSHDGVCITAQPIRSATELLGLLDASTEVVAIDEVQFLEDSAETVLDVVNRLADAGIRVIVAGTDMDFRGRPFGPIGALMAIAEKVDKYTAVCVICGGAATRNQRLVDGKPAPFEGPTVQVGGSDSYEARCRNCHHVPMHPAA